MAVPSNTFERFDSIGEREKLLDRIWDISPMETPFLSAIGRTSTDQVLHEWQTDSLRAAVTTNQAVEGDDATNTARTPTVRVGNHAQIAQDTLQVSGTVQATNKAGRNTELGYQIPRAGQALRRDMEANALSNATAAAGSSGTARVMAPMGSWIKSNTEIGTGAAADPTWTSGVATPRTDGTQQALTETDFKSVVEQAWDNGGKPTLVFANKFNRREISENFTGLSQTTVNINTGNRNPTGAIASIEFYVSDYGTLRVIPNRFQRERDLWVIDPTMATLPVLRNFRVEPLAKTGDSERRQMLIEYTLQVNNEAAHGGVFDLNTS